MDSVVREQVEHDNESKLTNLSDVISPSVCENVVVEGRHGMNNDSMHAAAMNSITLHRNQRTIVIQCTCLLAALNVITFCECLHPSGGSAT